MRTIKISVTKKDVVSSTKEPPTLHHRASETKCVDFFPSNGEKKEKGRRKMGKSQPDRSQCWRYSSFLMQERFRSTTVFQLQTFQIVESSQPAVFPSRIGYNLKGNEDSPPPDSCAQQNSNIAVEILVTIKFQYKRVNMYIVIIKRIKLLILYLSAKCQLQLIIEFV